MTRLATAVKACFCAFILIAPSFAQAKDPFATMTPGIVLAAGTDSFNWSNAAKDLTLKQDELPPAEERNIPHYNESLIQDFVPTTDFNFPSEAPVIIKNSDIMPAPKAAPISPVSKGTPLDQASNATVPDTQNKKDKIIILLDSVASPRHAYFYIAQELGLYAQSNMDVAMIAGADFNMVTEFLRTSKVQYALMSELEAASLLRKAEPISVIGTLISTPLPVLATNSKQPLRTIADLKGKKIGLFGEDETEKMLKTMIETVGLSVKDFKIIRSSKGELNSLKSKKFDAIMVPDRIRLEAQSAEDKYKLAYLYPEQAGVAVTDGLVLVTRTDQAGTQETFKLLQALDISSQFAINNPSMSYKLMEEKIPTFKTDLSKRQWEFAQKRLSRSPSAVSQYRIQSAQNLLKVTPIN